jgi:hypothetical protein
MANDGIVKDDRSDDEKAATIGFVVATDKFLGNWGRDIRLFTGNSIVACPVVSEDDRDAVEGVMRARREFTRVRYVRKVSCRAGDHLHIYDTVHSFRNPDTWPENQPQ